MCSFPHCLHEIEGSGNINGAAIDDGPEWGSVLTGSVTARGNVAEESVGGVLLVGGRDCLTPVGSVVRREVGGGTAEAVFGTAALLDRGEETTAKELVGLSLAGILKAALLGELGLDDECARRLFRNCCRSSSVLRC